MYDIPKPIPKKVVLHGDLKVIGKENAAPIVRLFIPKEEIIKKLGSIENLDKIDFTRIWLVTTLPPLRLLLDSKDFSP